MIAFCRCGLMIEGYEMPLVATCPNVEEQHAKVEFDSLLMACMGHLIAYHPDWMDVANVAMAKVGQVAGSQFFECRDKRYAGLLEAAAGVVRNALDLVIERAAKLPDASSNGDYRGAAVAPWP